MAQNARFLSKLLRRTHAQTTSNVAELKQFYTEEWVKMNPQPSETLIASYQKCLIAGPVTKGGTTKVTGFIYFFTL